MQVVYLRDEPRMQESGRRRMKQGRRKDGVIELDTTVGTWFDLHRQPP